MPKTGEANTVSGVYRSDCCGVERSMPDGHKFPPCPSKPGAKSCSGSGAGWTLVRRTQTK
jgi:hypothetical protein